MQCKSLLRKASQKQRSNIAMIFLLSLSLFGSSGYCTPKGGGVTSGPQAAFAVCNHVDPTNGTKLVQTQKWQDELFNFLCESADATEAWGLFDEGGLTGYGQFGQVMVVGSSKGARVYFVKMNGAEVDSQHSLQDPQLSTFLGSINTLSSGLQDHWDKGFDMFEREFVHIKKVGHEIDVAQRVKWRFGRAKCKEHCNLARAFESLVNKKSK